MLIVRTLAALAFLVTLLGAYAMAQSQEPPQQTPQIHVDQKPKSATKGQSQGEQNKSPPTQILLTIQQVQPDNTYRESESKPDERADKTSEYWPFPFFGHRLKITDSLLALFTFFLFIATGLLFYSTEKTANAAKDSADVARKTLIATNRAWVSIPFVALGRPLENGPPFIVQFRIVNVGKEPALGLKWLLKPIPIPYHPDGSSERDYSAPNAAVGEVHTDVESGGVLWTDTETKFWIPWRIEDSEENKAMLENVRSGKNSLIVDIAVAYTTVGKEHKSWARYFLRDVPSQSSGGWNFNLLPTGNGAD